MFVGEKKAGKSSLVNSIMRGEQYKMDADDRTVVADLLHWFPDGKDKTLFNIIDCGGHESYHITGHYFHRNNSNNVAVLCHDISRNQPDDYKKTFEWLKSIITRSPKCQIFIILTQKDKVTKEEKQVELFKQTFSNLLQKEISKLKINLKRAQRVKSVKTDIIESLIDTYSHIKDDILSSLIVTSCDKGQDESIDQVKKALLNMADRCKMLLPQSTQELFVQVGKSAARSNKYRLRTQEKSLALATKSVKNVKSQSPRAEDVSLKPDNKLSVKDTSTISKGKDTSLIKPYLDIEEIIPVYKSILDKLQLPSDDIIENLKNSLQFLHYQGFMMYYRSHNDLSDVVFHDMIALLEILKTVFDHDRHQIAQTKQKQSTKA